jgi:hypothetical protein
LRLQQALHQQRCVRCSFHQTCRRDDFHASGRCMPGYSVQRSPLSPKATLMARQSKLAPRHSGCSTVSTQYSSAAAAGRLGGSKVANTDHSPSSSRWMTGAGSCGCSVRADSCLAGAGRCGASCTRLGSAAARAGPLLTLRMVLNRRLCLQSTIIDCLQDSGKGGRRKALEVRSRDEWDCKDQSRSLRRALQTAGCGGGAVAALAQADARPL